MKSKTGQFTQFPNKLRKDASGIDPTSKFVFVILLREIKSHVGKKFNPSYRYIEKYYGINARAWKKSLQELQDGGYIKVDSKDSPRSGLNIEISPQYLTGEKYSMFPNGILLSDVFTVNQKIFIGFMIGEFLKDYRNNEGIIRLTKYKISEKLASISFKKTFIYRTLEELSNPDSGYVNIFIKTTAGYMFNFASFVAITDRSFDMYYCDECNGKYYRKKYTSPEKGQFKYCETTHSIIEDTSVIKQKAIKLTPEEVLRAEEEDMKKEMAQKEKDYYYQEDEINQFIKENGL